MAKIKVKKYLSYICDPMLIHVCFSRNITKGTYSHYVFSHVFLLLRREGVIWETTRPMGLTGYSLDEHQDYNSVHIILPIKSRLVRDIIDSNKHRWYGSCAVAVRQILKELKVVKALPSKKTVTADDLFLCLREQFVPAGNELASKLRRSGG